MKDQPKFLLISQIPPELLKRLEGSDPGTLDMTAVLLALQAQQTQILQSGATYIPSLAELYDQQFEGKPIENPVKLPSS